MRRNGRRIRCSDEERVGKRHCRVGYLSRVGSWRVYCRGDGVSPLYEYVCVRCRTITEEMRTIAHRDDTPTCEDCSTPTLRVMSVPTMHVWNKDRSFPNVSPHGDGTLTFPDRETYEVHLKEHGMAESSTSTPIIRPHGNRVIMRSK